MIMSYQNPTLIREPELRWPIVMLAAFITAVLTLLVAGMHHLAMGQPLIHSGSAAVLERALQPGQPEFEQFRKQIVIEHMVSKAHASDETAVQIAALVTNQTGRNLSGLEMRGAILDSQNVAVQEQRVVIIPARQTVLEPDEAINVHVMLERISANSDPGRMVLEVTGIRFD